MQTPPPPTSDKDPAVPAGRTVPVPAGRRIALFTGNYHHIPDGVSLTLNRLVRHLEDRGDRVLVFAPTVDDPPMRHAGTLVPVPSVSAPGRPEYRLSTGFPDAARAALEEFAPHIVHVATPDWLGFRALRWARAHGVPVVASYHTHFPSYLDYYRLGVLEPALWSYARWFYNRCAQVYVPSWPMADVLREHGVTTDVRLWTRGVELDRFSPAHRSNEWREAHGFGPHDVVIAFVSRLVWEKGLDVFAEVLAGLRRAGLPVHALIVGEGPAEEGLRSRMQPDDVFLGHLQGDELSTAYASSDIFLFPSETETFGNVTLEALASGLPVVAADAAGSRMLVDDGVTGRLCPPRDAASFMSATRGLVEDDLARSRMGLAARESAAQYAWPAVLDRLVGYYTDLLSVTPAH
jgi:glycosyltransferase involved in cell wall biosynthesis